MEDQRVISLERSGHVATVWLDRPQARNAMAPSFFEQLPVAMKEVSADDDVRAVVIAAKGSDFTVGLDLKAMSGLLSGAPSDNASRDAPGRAQSAAARAAAARPVILDLQRSISSVAECPKPVIAAIHGYCIGGGVDLATACDIRLSSEDALFSVRETKIAIVADLGSLQRLPRIVAKGHVAELAYTGKDITADRARQIGLLNDVLPHASDCQKAAAELAQEIASNSPLAVQGTKAVLRACEDRSVSEGLEYVATWNAGFLQSEDLLEAVTAFMEKRPPKFEGR